MGACQSCLGLRRHEDDESEHARLMDDDLYPGGYGYGYGSISNANQQQSDPEDLKREREALEAICQRASDTVIDIWALQSQPNFQPRATLPSNESPASSRISSSEIRKPVTDEEETRHEPSADLRETKTSSSSTNEMTTTKTRNNSHADRKGLAPPPNHWGEVVISPRRKKNQLQKGKASTTTTEGGGDIFGVLKV